ncbi:polysaccharide biosynthesis C-terminal domain-containing protein [Anaerostipes hominis (ex Lee et al. 2021)]|uniref:Polysaccharide biosynthesis C-terminal domain-containing protein n=2 Tax=Lachnospiraceae TaxID=186803 RepID=A0ABV4DG25_9FIRM|nr:MULTISPECIES: polysaccharide biosynthesis C-terminal domain-containing protein [Anaerostipes]
MLLGAIINIILDPVFIFGLHWGMKGAALATVTGQFLPSYLKQHRLRITEAASF